MPPPETLIGFVVAALIVLLLPGPGVLYVVARSASQGRRAGLISVLGLSTGAFIHVLAAAAGLSAILLMSATAFSAVKLLGAAYLIFLGLQIVLSRSADRQPAGDVTPTRALRRVFADGVLVSVLNPKIALFFLAFLPQFVTPDGFPVSQQMLLLGFIYIGLGLLTDGAYALLAAGLADRLRRHVSQNGWFRYPSGLIYIGLGVRALTLKAPQ